MRTLILALRLTCLLLAWAARSPAERRYYRFRSGWRQRGPDDDGIPNLDEEAQRAEMRASCLKGRGK